MSVTELPRPPAARTRRRAVTWLGVGVGLGLALGSGVTLLATRQDVQVVGRVVGEVATSDVGGATCVRTAGSDVFCTHRTDIRPGDVVEGYLVEAGADRQLVVTGVERLTP